MFAALGDPIRLRILDVLGEVERCACEIQGLVGTAPNLLSYHLRVLREAGLVEGSRRGRWIDYRLVAGADALVAGMLPMALQTGVAS